MIEHYDTVEARGITAVIDAGGTQIVKLPPEVLITDIIITPISDVDVSGVVSVNNGQQIDKLAHFDTADVDANLTGFKMKFIDGITADTQGGEVSVLHGLPDISKIIAITGTVTFIDGRQTARYPINTSWSSFELQVRVNTDGNHLNIRNAPSNSNGILSSQFRVFIIYEEN